MWFLGESRWLRVLWVLGLVVMILLIILWLRIMGSILGNDIFFF